MYGGDDVNGVVIDFGSFYTRAGQTGQDAPRKVVQSKMGAIQDPSTGTINYKIGESEINYYKDNMKIYNVIKDDGSIDNFDQTFNRLCEQIFTNSLQLKSKEHPVLLAQPSRHNKTNRMKLTQYMFETLRVPALYICKSAVLSGFSYARATCVVIDSGASQTVVTPVVDGFALQKCIHQCHLGGNYITDQLQHYFDEKKTPIIPRFRVKSKRTQLEEAQYHRDQQPDKTYQEYQKREIIRDFKQSRVGIKQSLFSNTGLPEVKKMTSAFPISSELDQHEDVKDGIYQLPDGNILQTDQFIDKIGVAMFSSDLGISGFSGYQDLVVQCINKTDIDIKRDLFSNILLVGGNSCMKGFKKKLDSKLQECAPANQKIKLMANSQTQRKNAAWIGGSILSCLGTFQQMWMSQQEYQEHGAILIERKCA